MSSAVTSAETLPLLPLHDSSHKRGQRQAIDDAVRSSQVSPAADQRPRRRRRLRPVVRCLSKVVSCFMRAAGPVLFGIVWLLVALIAHAYVAYILPRVGLDPFSLWGFVYSCPGYFLAMNLLYNHLMAAYTKVAHRPDPQSIPANIDALIQQERVDLAHAKKRASFSLYCADCRAPKPPRTQHCSICRCCVLKMDHHCPWIMNCVGHANLKYFYRWILYLFLSCVYVVAFGIPAIMWPQTDRGGVGEQTMTLFAVTMCAAGAFSLGFMLVLHTYLLATNQTTVEFYNNREFKRYARTRGEVFRNPYDLGWYKNIQQVFGVHRSWISWLLPGAAEIGDGTTFPTVGPASSLASSHIV